MESPRDGAAKDDPRKKGAAKKSPRKGIHILFYIQDNPCAQESYNVQEIQEVKEEKKIKSKNSRFIQRRVQDNPRFNQEGFFTYLKMGEASKNQALG